MRWPCGAAHRSGAGVRPRLGPAGEGHHPVTDGVDRRSLPGVELHALVLLEEPAHGRAVAVRLIEGRRRADRALGKLKIEWDAGAYGRASDGTIAAMLREGLADPKIAEARRTGDVSAAFSSAAIPPRSQTWNRASAPEPRPLKW